MVAVDGPGLESKDMGRDGRVEIQNAGSTAFEGCLAAECLADDIGPLGLCELSGSEVETRCRARSRRSTDFSDGSGIGTGRGHECAGEYIAIDQFTSGDDLMRVTARESSPATPMSATATHS
jgi:hypothetical protein